MQQRPYANLTIFGASQAEVNHWHSTFSYPVPAYISPTMNSITTYFGMGIYHSDTTNDAFTYWVNHQGRACLYVCHERLGGQHATDVGQSWDEWKARFKSNTYRDAFWRIGEPAPP